MPPSSAKLPPDRSYREVPLNFLDENNDESGDLQELLTKMKISSSSEISVDALADCLRDSFRLQGDDSNIRGLATFIMKLNLKDYGSSSVDENSEQTHDSETTHGKEFVSDSNKQDNLNQTIPSGKAVDTHTESIRSSSRDRCNVPRTPPVSADTISFASTTHPPSSLTRGAPRNSKAFGTNGKDSANTANESQTRSSSAEKTPVFNASNSNFVFSPPSSTGTFDSFFSPANTPEVVLGSPTVATPIVENNFAAGLDMNKTGIAKRRNKNETTPPVLNGYQSQGQSTFHQSVKSPPQFNVNLKNSKKPGHNRMRRPQPRQPPNADQGNMTSQPSQHHQQKVVESRIPFLQSPLSTFETQTPSGPFPSVPHPQGLGALHSNAEPKPSADLRENADEVMNSNQRLFSPMDVEVKFNMGSSHTSKGNSPGSRVRRHAQRKSPRQMHNPRCSLDSYPVELFQQSGSRSEAMSRTLAGVNTEPGTLSASDMRDSREESVDFTGRDAMVDAFRNEAKDLYRKGDYHSAVLRYTVALVTHNRMASEGGPDDRRAVLLANRSAALLMLGAYDAAVSGCKQACGYVTEMERTLNGEYNLSGEGGPFLKAKICTRMGRAYVKKGALDDAQQAFDQALEISNMVLRSIQCLSVENRTLVNQVQVDVNTGKTEIARCREALETIRNCGLVASEDTTSASRIMNLRALSSINSALNLAPGWEVLWQMKLAVLVSLNRWREVYLSCERIASDTVNLDGVFTEDLQALCPLPNVSIARYLRAGLSETEVTAKLSSKAVAEVTLRLPAKFQPIYIRALRLEERCHAALNSLNVLCEFVNKFVPGVDALKTRWIVDELKKLDQTIKAKDSGDSLFRTGDYQGAVDQYTACLKIDSADRPLESEGFAGGRLHAVLYCNRAAASMALFRYREAISDCTAALRIHSHYMKAMLRRSRCYVRLNRFDEAQSEYERYISLVEAARGPSAMSGAFEDTTCVFDGPKDVSDSNLQTVKDELKEVKRAKLNMENNKRREEQERQNRQDWYHEAFGQSRVGDAERRRQEWYNQQGKGSRRWDSFNGRAPSSQGNHSHKWQSSKDTGTSSRRSKSYRDEQSQDKQQRRESTRQEERKENMLGSPGSDKSLCHYKVLQVATNATESEIKKAYKMAALKYHPDKNQQSDASDMFRRIKLAYDVLKDPTQKREYDTQLRWNRRF